MPAPGHLGLETAPSPHGTRRSRRLHDRPAVRIIAVLLAAALTWLGWSLGHALTTPGGGTVAQRVAEWARDHYLGPLVTFGEWVTLPAAEGRRHALVLAGRARPHRFQRGRRPAPGPGTGARPGQRARLHARRPRCAPRRAGRCAARASGGCCTASITPGHLRHLPAAGPRAHLLRGRHRVDEPAPAAVPSCGPAPRTRGPAATAGRSRSSRPATAAAGRDLQRRLQDRLSRRRFLPQRDPPGRAALGCRRRWSTTATASLAIGIWGHHGLRMSPASPECGRTCGRSSSTARSRRPSTRTCRAAGVRPWAAATTSGARASASPATAGSSSPTGPPWTCGRWPGCCAGRAASTAMQLDINPEWTNFMYYRPGRHPADPVPAAGGAAARANRDFTESSPDDRPLRTVTTAAVARLHRRLRPAQIDLIGCTAAAPGAPSAGPGLPRAGVWLRAVITTARPRQWPKNLLVLAAPLAAASQGRDDGTGYALVALAAFTAASAAVYFINDVADASRDRRHPVKSPPAGCFRRAARRAGRRPRGSGGDPGPSQRPGDRRAMADRHDRCLPERLAGCTRWRSSTCRWSSSPAWRRASCCGRWAARRPRTCRRRAGS